MKLITEIIKHVEENLESELSVETLSAASGYSPHHFQKMFAATVGVSLGAYIRRRRLTKAADRLVSTQDRILDIAQMAGFDSQEAFTRAFKTMFASTPKAYRDLNPPLSLTAQAEASSGFLRHLRYEGVDKTPRFEERSQFAVIGLKDRFERGQTVEIGSRLWPEFARRFSEIPNKRGGDENSFITFGVCQEIWLEGHIQDVFHYAACVEVDPETPVPDGMDMIIIPRQTYAVFTHRGGIQNLSHTHQYIWGTWLAQSGAELTEASDLEVYPSGFSPDNTTPFEIWVPIQTRRLS